MTFFHRPEFTAGGPPALLASTSNPGGGPRFEIQVSGPDGALFASAIAFDRDLQRPVRLQACLDPELAADFARRVERLLRLEHPGLLAAHRLVRLRDGVPLAVFGHLPVARSDPSTALADPARLALLAGALAHAAARGVELPGAVLDRAFVAGERTVWDFTPSAADLRQRPERPGSGASSRRLAVQSRPEDAVQSFGRFLQQVLRRSGRRSRYLRKIARAAREGRYPDARALADDLERLAAGDPVSVAIDGPLRRIRRVARRRPVALALSFVLLAALVAGGLVLKSARERRRAFLEAEAAAVTETIRLARERLVPRLASAAAAHAARAKAWVEREEAYHATPELQPTPRERKIERVQRVAGVARAGKLLLARAELFAIAAAPERLTDEVAAAFPARVRAARKAADEARRRLGLLAVEEVEEVFRAAEFEEGRTLSTETLSLLRDTAKLTRQLDDRTLPADRVAALKARLVPRGTLVVSPLPDGVTAMLHEIRNGPRWQLVPGKPVAAGTHALPAGNHLLILSRARDRQTFRFPLLVRRGQVVQPDLRLPRAVPAGFVYCPPGPFYRGGPGLNQQRYRRDRIKQGFFIGQREVTIAEYREFLLAVKAGPRGDRIPILFFTNRRAYVLAGAALEIAPELQNLVRPDYPVFGISHTAATAYARWRGFRLPSEAEWEYAARGAAGRPFPHGDAFSTTLANVKGYKGARYWSPVGQPETDCSIFGVLGLGGNVTVWTRTQNADKLWIVKGGSFGTVANIARCAARNADAPVARSPDIGLRLAVGTNVR